MTEYIIRRERGIDVDSPRTPKVWGNRRILRGITVITSDHQTYVKFNYDPLRVLAIGSERTLVYHEISIRIESNSY